LFLDLYFVFCDVEWMDGEFKVYSQLLMLYLVAYGIRGA